MKAKAKVTANVTRLVQTIERPFKVAGVHAGRRSCWVEVELLGEKLRVHVKAPLFDKLKAAGVPVAEYDSAFARRRTENQKKSSDE
jgi:hypothetical protein